MKKEIKQQKLSDSALKNERNHGAVNQLSTSDVTRKEDKRREVRQEHTNHFTSREGYTEKK
jgi:hypothetical protein